MVKCGKCSPKSMCHVVLAVGVDHKDDLPGKGSSGFEGGFALDPPAPSSASAGMETRPKGRGPSPAADDTETEFSASTAPSVAVFLTQEDKFRVCPACRATHVECVVVMGRVRAVERSDSKVSDRSSTVRNPSTGTEPDSQSDHMDMTDPDGVLKKIRSVSSEDSDDSPEALAPQSPTRGAKSRVRTVPSVTSPVLGPSANVFTVKLHSSVGGFFSASFVPMSPRRSVTNGEALSPRMGRRTSPVPGMPKRQQSAPVTCPPALVESVGSKVAAPPSAAALFNLTLPSGVAPALPPTSVCTTAPVEGDAAFAVAAGIWDAGGPVPPANARAAEAQARRGAAPRATDPFAYTASVHSSSRSAAMFSRDAGAGSSRVRQGSTESVRSSGLESRGSMPVQGTAVVSTQGVPSASPCIPVRSSPLPSPRRQAPRNQPADPFHRMAAAEAAMAWRSATTAAAVAQIPKDLRVALDPDGVSPRRSPFQADSPTPEIPPDGLAFGPRSLSGALRRHGSEPANLNALSGSPVDSPVVITDLVMVPPSTSGLAAIIPPAAATPKSKGEVASMLVRHLCAHCGSRIAHEDFERERAAAAGFCSQDCMTMYRFQFGESSVA
jgi:hypothetical protein